MATIKFHTRPPKDGISSIYFRLSYGAFEIVNGKKRYRPLEYYISESIEPKHWNKKEGRAVKTRAFPQHTEFNARLDNIENDILNIVRRLTNDEIELTHESIRKEIDILFGVETKKQTIKVELMDFISQFIETADRSEGTKKSYRRVERDLQEYQKKQKTVLTFDRIDIDFHASFVQYLKSKKYSPNTIGTRIKVLKTFMNEALERNLHNSLDFKKRSFNKPNEETRAVYLSVEELNQMHKLDLSIRPHLDNVRDWFLIGAYTGLRFSDLSRLTKENIKENILEIRTQKTEKIVTIPLHPIVKQILEKHKYKLPKLISNQKFNVSIKEVAKLADINEDTLIEETKGKMKTKRSEPKYKLISAHTARRSFATNAFLADVPPIQIMKMTGHKSESSFLKYIKISDEENANKLTMHPFFKMTVIK